MKIQLLNKIAQVGLNELGPAYTVGENIADPDGIMVRSAVMHEMEFSPNLKAIARAGAGVNNIPVDRCSIAGIVVFNTPGANANGVRELAICALLLAARDVVGGIEWAKTLTGDVAKQVEKGKSQFAGTELAGKTLGVIGLGAIGGLIANMGIHLGMKVIGCDPFLSVEGAWNLNHRVERAATFDEIFAAADYVTDFPTEEILHAPHAVAIPHLGASTEESENNCAVMAARELDDFLVNGNITNSVNFPNVSSPRTGKARICALHANVPAVITQITAALSDEGINIENMTNKSKGDNAYTVLDVAEAPSQAALDRIAAISGLYRVRAV